MIRSKSEWRSITSTRAENYETSALAEHLSVHELQLLNTQLLHQMTHSTAPQAARPCAARLVGRARCSRHHAATTTAAASSPSPPASAGPRVVVLGGGFGGLTAALRLAALPWADGARACVTLVDRGDRFVFKPLLYELLTSELGEDEVAPPFAQLLEGTGVSFVRADVASVAPDAPLRAPRPAAAAHTALLDSNGGAGGGEEASVAGSVGGGTVYLRRIPRRLVPTAVAGATDGDSGEEDALEALPYDYLVVSLGCAPSASRVPGAAAHSLPLHSLPDARRAKAALDAADGVRRLRVAQAAASSAPFPVPPVRIAVVGGGLAGVELACSVSAPGRSVSLVVSDPSGPMPQKSRGTPFGDAAKTALEAAGVRVLAGRRAAEVVKGPNADPSLRTPTEAETSPPFTLRVVPSPSLLQSQPGGGGASSASAASSLAADESESETLPAELVFWAAGQVPEAPHALGPAWDLHSSGGKLEVDATLRARRHERVFALGDAALLDTTGGATSTDSSAAAPPPPATAQVALQQADFVAWNVWASALGRPALPFRYQPLGEMLALGVGLAAVATPIPGLTLSGSAAALLRRAVYAYRQPTPAQGLKVGAAFLWPAAAPAAAAATSMRR